MSEEINFIGQAAEALSNLSGSYSFTYSEFGNHNGKAGRTTALHVWPVAHMWASAFEVAAYAGHFERLDAELAKLKYMSPWAPAFIQRNVVGGPFFRRDYDDEWGVSWKHFFKLAFKYSSVDKLLVPTPYDKRSGDIRFRRSSLLDYFFKHLVTEPITAKGFKEEDPSWHVALVKILVTEFIISFSEDEMDDAIDMLEEEFDTYKRIIELCKVEDFYHIDVTHYLEDKINKLKAPKTQAKSS